MKAKVDAYERHVKESKIPITPKYVHVPRVAAASQPLPVRMRDNDTTPLKAGGQGLLGSASSDQTGNKLAHMKKVLGKGALSGSDSARGSASTVSSASAKSRSNSAEDPKRMALVLQEIAEQKKKKREEKQRVAQLNREKLEREKKEQMDRLAKEREEKAKKFLQEKAEQARIEKKKQAMARLAMENNQQLKIKEMQMKQKAAQGWVKYGCRRRAKWFICKSISVTLLVMAGIYYGVKTLRMTRARQTSCRHLQHGAEIRWERN